MKSKVLKITPTTTGAVNTNFTVKVKPPYVSNTISVKVTKPALIVSDGTWLYRGMNSLTGKHTVEYTGSQVPKNVTVTFWPTLYRYYPVGSSTAKTYVAGDCVNIVTTGTRNFTFDPVGAIVPEYGEGSGAGAILGQLPYAPGSSVCEGDFYINYSLDGLIAQPQDKVHIMLVNI